MQPQESDPLQSAEPLQPPHAVGDIIHPDGQIQRPSAAPAPTPFPVVSSAPEPSLPAQPLNVPVPQASNQLNGTALPGPTLSPPPFVSSSETQEQKPRRRFKPSKRLLLVVLVILLLGGGGAGAYFGYYVPNKPSNVWRTALTNTQTGYDKLTTWATSKKNAKGLSVDGNFKLSGVFDGTFSGQSDGKNSELNGSISAAGAKVNYDVRTIAAQGGNTPDIYFKLDGLQGVGSLIGSYISDPTSKAEVTKALNGLNGQWYFIDHSLFNEVAQGSNSTLQFSSADIIEVLNAVGNADKQYLFTNDTSKMAVVVKQYVGKEKQDNLSVYHYKIGVDKTNLNAYGKALCGNLVKTKLFKMLEGTATTDQDLISQCQDSLGLSKVDTSRTADAWVDLHTKLIHKIRFTDKGNANSYTDIAQNYQGGSIFPFSIATHDVSNGDTQTAALNMNLDMNANTFTADATYGDTGPGSGSAGSSGTFHLSVKPNNSSVKVTAPTGSKTIIQLMNDLGLGDLISGISSGATTGASADVQSRDSQRKDDIARLQAQVEVYRANNNGDYPTSLSQLPAAAASACQAPGGKGTCANPDFIYVAFSSKSDPAVSAKSDCNNTTITCQHFRISTPNSGAGAMETTASYSVTDLQ